MRFRDKKQHKAKATVTVETDSWGHITVTAHRGSNQAVAFNVAASAVARVSNKLKKRV